jgi:hypothetical protein
VRSGFRATRTSSISTTRTLYDLLRSQLANATDRANTSQTNLEPTLTAISTDRTMIDCIAPMPTNASRVRTDGLITRSSVATTRILPSGWPVVHAPIGRCVRHLSEASLVASLAVTGRTQLRVVRIAVQRSAYAIQNSGTWVLIALVPAGIWSVMPISSNARAVGVVPLLIVGAIVGAYKGFNARLEFDDEAVRVVNGVRRWTIPRAEVVGVDPFVRWKGDDAGGFRIERATGKAVKSVADFDPAVRSELRPREV